MQIFFEAEVRASHHFYWKKISTDIFVDNFIQPQIVYAVQALLSERSETVRCKTGAPKALIKK
jgi:hypothetical protein